MSSAKGIVHIGVFVAAFVLLGGAHSVLPAQGGCKACSIWFSGCDPGQQCQHAECITWSGQGSYHDCYTDGVTCSVVNPCGRILTRSEFTPDGSVRGRPHPPSTPSSSRTTMFVAVSSARNAFASEQDARTERDCGGRIAVRRLSPTEILTARQRSQLIRL